MKLELTQKLQQQQILAPQMILSMDILLLTAADLQQRIEQEFMENPALEMAESSASPATSAGAADGRQAGICQRESTYRRGPTSRRKPIV